MHKWILKPIATATASLLLLSAIPSQAITEDGVYPPPGGWGNEPITSSGGFSDAYAAVGELERVTVTGKYEDSWSPVYVVNVPAPPLSPVVEAGGSSPPDPVQQKACMDSCDTKQKIAKDLCDVAAAKIAAGSTVAAIGAGAAVGGLLT